MAPSSCLEKEEYPEGEHITEEQFVSDQGREYAAAG